MFHFSSGSFHPFALFFLVKKIKLPRMIYGNIAVLDLVRLGFCDTCLAYEITKGVD